MQKVVFHIITRFDLGGAEIVASNICKSKSGEFEYHLISVVRTDSEYNHRFIKEMEADGVQCHQALCKNNKLGIILFPIFFVWLFIKYQPAVIHTHTEVSDLSLYVFRKLFSFLSGWKKVKLVRTIHNTRLWSDWSKIGDKVEVLFKQSHANIAISKSVQQSYFEQYGVTPPIIYNGVAEVPQIKFKELEDGKINILFAGRFEEQKGISTLVKILDHYKNDDRFFFHIVGSGSMQDQIEKITAGMTNQRLYKSIYNLPAYYGSFDYVLIPSNFEGLSLTSVEASMAKTPVLVNISCAGLNETIPEDWALMVHENNLKEWYQLFEKLPQLDRKNLGEEAYEFVSEKFAIEKMQQEYEKFYIS
jgi:glycosyltransferase involved in cell wall biosynthesis